MTIQSPASGDETIQYFDEQIIAVDRRDLVKLMFMNHETETEFSDRNRFP